MLLTAGTASAADEPTVLNIWPGDPPGAIADPPAETLDDNGSVGNVTTPQIAVHLPPAGKATGLAMLVCPGGSYRVVGRYATGAGAVDRFVPQGVAVIVVKYRTRPPSTDVFADALADATRAMRLVRLHADEWHIDPNRIGMLGGSAGGHLALNTAAHGDAGDPQAADPVDRQSSRPDFVALLCPWPGGQTVEAFPIDSDMPPVFAASAIDDPVAPTQFARDVVAACEAANVPARLWTVERGGHRAFSEGVRGPGAQWGDELVAWLIEQGIWIPQ
jgi:endo-1,4-beta-xylanase